MHTILIIDDDVSIGNMVQTVLARAGYGVMRAYSGTEAVLLLKTATPDLILLDLMLPGLSGEDVLPMLDGIPTIVVSAKGSIDDKVKLLGDGAVDYITKPFDTKELLARIAVHLRDRNPGRIGQRACALACGCISLDEASHEVKVSGASVQLTRTEYAILRLLMQNQGSVVTKSTILDRIGDDTPDCTESSLKTHVSHLRCKLREASHSDADFVESVWGIGFRLNA